MEKGKKYCRNCNNYKIRYDFNQQPQEECTYKICTCNYIAGSCKPRYLIPSIHNYNHDCPYYVENWLDKILRRFKK